MAKKSKPPLGVHGHAHEHPRTAPHVHPHHHDQVVPPAHAHTHTVSFERFTYVCSPVHSLDPRAKLIAALAMVAAIVLGGPPRAAEFVLLVCLLLALALLARLPLVPLALRSLLVVPIAGGIALFSPLAQLSGPPTAQAAVAAYSAGWISIWAIVSKAWLSASIALLVAATTPFADLIAALRWFRVPMVFLTLLTFLSRYAGVLRDQLTSLRRALASRAPDLSGTRLLKAYGDISGNLFMRAYERGERVHAAMLARGYDGALPTHRRLKTRPIDGLAVVLAALVAAAVGLY